MATDDFKPDGIIDKSFPKLKLKPRDLTPQFKDPVEEAVKTLIHFFGDDYEREGLRETPARFRRWIEEFRQKGNDLAKLTTFENEGYDEMIIQKDIPFFSLCEHHMLPFVGFACVAYIPEKKLLGLSKLARIVDHFSYRLQNQERITKQVADFLQEKLDPKGVAVSLKARHMCMELRGVMKHNTWTTTSFLTGAFRENLSARNEFLSLIA